MHHPVGHWRHVHLCYQHKVFLWVPQVSSSLRLGAIVIISHFLGLDQNKISLICVFVLAIQLQPYTTPAVPSVGTLAGHLKQSLPNAHNSSILTQLLSEPSKHWYWYIWEPSKTAFMYSIYILVCSSTASPAIKHAIAHKCKIWVTHL